MKTFEEIRDSLCEERLKHNWVYVQIAFSKPLQDDISEEAAKIYAQQVAEDVRQRCYNNSEIDFYGDCPYINRDSILDTEIILP